MSVSALLPTLQLAKNAVPLGTVWLHKKGGVYRVVGHDIDTDDGSARVRYLCVAGTGYDSECYAEVCFSRPLAEWTSDRFTKIGGPITGRSPSE